MGENLSIFEGEEPVEDIKEAEEVQAEPVAEVPEGEGVKPEAPAEPEAAPPAAAEEKQQHHAPITALMDEREKRQAAERAAEEARKEAAEAKKRWEDYQRQQAQQRQKPDFFDKPEEAVQRQVMAMKLEQSRFLAERDFGAEMLGEVQAFFDRPENHQASQTLLQHPSPFHAAVEYYKRQTFLAEVGDDPDKWREAERERLRQELLAEAPQPSTKPKPLPGSLSAAPAAGGNEPAAVNAPANLQALFTS